MHFARAFLSGLMKNLGPAAFVLEQHYPDPFNAATTIAYQLSERWSRQCAYL